jgi:chaperonin GroES
MRARPTGNKIIVKIKSAATVTDGGIHIPEAVQEKPAKGTVVATGVGVYQNGTFCENEAKVGDVVMFGKYAGTEIEIDEEKFTIMLDTDVLVVLE